MTISDLLKKGINLTNIGGGIDDKFENITSPINKNNMTPQTRWLTRHSKHKHTLATLLNRSTNTLLNFLKSTFMRI